MPVLTPEQLLNDLQLSGSKGRFTLTGMVSEHSHITTHASFIKLKGVKNIIKCRLPHQLPLPNLNSQIEATGNVFLSVPNNGFTCGYEVILDIEKYHVLQEPQYDNLKRDQEKMSLQNFVAQHGTYKIKIIATSGVGFKDLESEFKKHYPNGRLFYQSADMTCAESLLLALDDAILGGAKAVLFARGGGDRSSMSLWDDPQFIAGVLERRIPFYIAVGHAKDQFAIHNYADEAFSTPTSAGAALAAGLRQKYQKTEPKSPVQSEEGLFGGIWRALKRIFS